MSLKQDLYEILVPAWPLPRGKTRWLNLVTSVLGIGPYGRFKYKPVGEYRLALDPGDANDLHYFFERIGAGYLFLMRRLLRPGDCVLDVGVNVGYFSAICAQLVGRAGQVHAVEASPIMIERLRKMISEVPGGPVRLHHAAAWRTPGVLSFHVAKEVSGWSALTENETFETAQSVEVQAITIDDLVARERLDRVRVLKLDIEGAETDALLGARATLARRSIDFVLAETEPTRLRAFGYTGKEMADLMDAHGYRPACIIEADRIVPVTEDRRVPGKGNIDYLYVRDDLYDATLPLVLNGR